MEKYSKPKQMLNSKLIVKLDPSPTQTIGGIALPDNAKEKPVSGVVIDCCQWNTNLLGEEHNIDLIDQRVFFPNYCGVLLTDELKLIDFNDLWWVENT